jgi:hypothetical protein
VALSGSDNATIARNAIAEAQEGDVVVVLWSDFGRFNTFHDDREQRTDRPGDRHLIWQSGMHLSEDKVRTVETGGWHQSGLVWHNKPFLTEYYHRIERFRTTLDYIRMLEMHAEIHNYSVWNFVMSSWFLGGLEKSEDARLRLMQERSGIKHLYLQENIHRFRENTLPITVQLPYGTDTHPTPWVHWLWLEKHVAPEMGIELDPLIGDIAQKDQEDLLAGRLVT